MSEEGGYRAPRRLYLTRDRERVVEEGDPEAGFLLAGAGTEVPEADVRRYKLRELPSEAEGQAATPEPEAKMVEGPPEDKAKPAPRRAARSKDGA